MGNLLSSNRCKFQASLWSRCSHEGKEPGGYCCLHGCYECGKSMSIGGWETDRSDVKNVSITRPITILYSKDSPVDILWTTYNLCEQCENLEKYPRCNGCNNQYTRLMKPGNRCGMSTCK